MASYDSELLLAAATLLKRDAGKRGQLPRARIRRSISTAYYALFHFLIEEISAYSIGTSAPLLRRRRIVSRSLSHSGIRSTFEKIRGAAVEKPVEDYFRAPAGAQGQVVLPQFLTNMARVFLDAQTKRIDADYDLNEVLSEGDARLLITRVKAAIAQWRVCDQANDRALKRALLLLMLMKGQLRKEN